MDWIKAIQIGFYIIQRIQEFMSTGSSSFSFDVSYRGQVHVVNVSISKRLSNFIRTQNYKVF